MNKVICAKPLDEYKMYLEFSDGTTGIVDLSDYAGKGVFSVWEDYQLFEKVGIGSSGELIWGDTADLCPDALYMRLKKMRPEDVFPNLRREPAHA
jgi:hypothetical protein